MLTGFHKKILGVSFIPLSVFAALLTLEIIMRIAGIGNAPLYAPDPLLGVTLIPNAAYKYNQEGYSEGKINSNGLRDHEIPHAKKEGETRILVLGDSFMEAFQVNIDSSFTKLLQKFANEALPGSNVTVINGGRSGMGTAEEYLWYKKEGVKYNPDIVLLAFYAGNDFRDNSKTLTGTRPLKPYIVFSDDGSFAADLSFKDSRLFALRSLLHLFCGRSVLAAETVRRIRTASAMFAKQTASAKPCAFDLDVFNENPDSAWDSAYAVTEKQIALLRNEVISNSSEFCIMLIPDSYQTEQPESECVKGRDLLKPNKFLREAAASRRIPLFDLFDTFDSEHRQNGSHMYGFGENLGNGHWNEKGHMLAAKTIASNPDFLNLLERVRQER
jgi:hypothetical protein